MLEWIEAGWLLEQVRSNNNHVSYTRRIAMKGKWIDRWNLVIVLVLLLVIAMASIYAGGYRNSANHIKSMSIYLDSDQVFEQGSMAKCV